MNKSFKKFLASIAGVAMAIGAVAGIASNKNVFGLKAAYTGESPWSHTFVTSDVTEAAQENKVLNNVSWNISAATYKGWDNTKGIQIGSSGAPQTTDWTMTAAVSQFGTSVGITSISVSISTASKGGIAWSLTAGGNNGTNSTGSSDSAISSVTTKTATYTTPVTSGYVVIALNSNGKAKAIYIHDISIGFTSVGGGDSTSSSNPSSNSSGSSESSSSSSSAPATYSVTYDPNEATSGSVPEDANEYSNNAEVTVLGNTGTLEKTGFIWKCWNTKADGTGIDYSQNNTFNITSDITLYARWVKDYTNVDYVDITGLYLNLPTSSASSYTSEETVCADDGMDYIIAPSASEGKAYATTSNPASGTTDNSFVGGSNSKIFIGKSGAYLYNKDPFQKSINKVEVYASAGCSKGVNVAIDLGTTLMSDSCTTDSVNLGTQNHVYTFYNNQASNNYTYFRFEVANANNANVQIRITFAKPTSSVTVTPESVTLAPGQTQQLTTEVLPNDTTDSLSYSTSAEGVATVSSSGLITAVAPGSAVITATSGNKSDTCEVTVNAASYIDPEKDSTSGYTGQNEVVSFTYGYLTGTLSVSSNDLSVVTVQDLIYENGEGLVQINFVGVGSTTVSFNDGLTEKGSLSVSVTASSVSITGLAASSSVYIEGTLDLGSTITVTAVGTYEGFDDVTWESDDENIATVSAAGVVTGVADGTVDITVTSDYYPSATMTCSVTVSRASFVKVNSFENGKRYLIAAVGNSDPNELYYLPAGTEEVAKNPTAVQIQNIDDLTKDDAWTASVDASNHIVFSNEYGGETYYLVATDTAQGISISSTNGGYWILDNTGLQYSDGGTRYLGTNANSSFRYYSSLGSGQVYATEFYEYIPTTADKVNDLMTQTKLAYHYQKDENDQFNISNISIRFGGLISKELWDELDTNEHVISGFGVMIVSGDILASNEYIKNNLNEAVLADDVSAPSIANGNIVDYYMSKAEMATPVEQGDNYFWNLFQRVDSDKITDVFVAVAYIKIGDEYVFMKQVRYSVKSLANDYLENRGCDDTTADGSLANLAA